MAEDDDIVGRVEVPEIDYDSVQVDQQGSVVTITFNRPARRNATTYPMLNRYFDILDQADCDPSVRVIVLTGAGTSFCVGMDTASLAEASSEDLRRRPAKNRRMNHSATIRKPIIAAINGACAGFGLILAMDCDIRFAAESAVFSTAFVRRGLAAEYGSSWMLPRIVGQGRAAELLLSGRKFDASEAERIGLVSRLIPADRLMEHTVAYATDVAEYCSPRAMADTKHQLSLDWTLARDHAQDRAKVLSHEPGHRIDFAEGVASYREKRRPNFAPLTGP